MQINLTIKGEICIYTDLYTVAFTPLDFLIATNGIVRSYSYSTRDSQITPYSSLSDFTRSLSLSLPFFPFFLPLPFFLLPSLSFPFFPPPVSDSETR